MRKPGQKVVTRILAVCVDSRLSFCAHGFPVFVSSISLLLVFCPAVFIYVGVLESVDIWTMTAEQKPDLVLMYSEVIPYLVYTQQLVVLNSYFV